MESNHPRLSVIVIFYNMRREAMRTLFTLSAYYQRNISESDFEIIAIDNGSSEPLDPEVVCSFGKNFRYYYFDTSAVSPVEAINFGVTQAVGEMLSICIDGARMVSPGILSATLSAASRYPNPVICTLAWHLGDKLQNISVSEGYDQIAENRLLDSIKWKEDGYLLFSIATIAASSRGGCGLALPESNFLSMSRPEFNEAGGFDERFQSPGGGLANHHLLGSLSGLPSVNLIHLEGEGTFHQFHGGVATNVETDNHPWAVFAREYEQITGNPYSESGYTPIVFRSESVPDNLP